MRLLNARSSGEACQRYLKTDGIAISERALNLLRIAGILGPPETGIKLLVQDSLNWRAQLRMVFGCGPSTLKEIEGIAAWMGLDTEPKLDTRAFNVLAAHGIRSVDELKRLMMCSPDWRKACRDFTNCGKKTFENIERAAQQLGIL